MSILDTRSTGMREENLKALKDLLSKCEQAESETAKLERDIEKQAREEVDQILSRKKESIKT